MTDVKKDTEYNQAKQVAEDKKHVKDVPHKKTMRDVLLEDRATHPVVSVEAHLPYNVDEPLPDPVLTPLTPEEQKRKDAKDALLKQIGEILGKYDNRESSVPPESPYWGLVNQYRSL